MSQSIKFGTDGWRAIIAQEFTVTNVQRVTEGVASWLAQNFENPSVVVGHDCRFGGELFADNVTRVLLHHGVKVYLAKGFVTTPMISLGALKCNVSLGIILTASHNPPTYNGYKLKGNFGGPLLPKHISEVEELIPSEIDTDYTKLNINEFEKSGKLEYVDLETMYADHVRASFDLEAIKNSSLNLAFDSMYGAGQRIMHRLFPEIKHIHNEHNPSFYGIAPEPILKNLQEFSTFIKKDGNIHCGLATDGDADRIGLFDSKGNFVDSHHIILLLIHYLVKYKNFDGEVVIAFSVSDKVKKLCEHYGLNYQVTQIGFKHIAGIMLEEDVLLGGEESGGIAIKGHIPERDGLWMGLVIWEFMAKSGKTLEELIEEVYQIVGAFYYDRRDLHLTEEQKQKVIVNCKSNKYTKFGTYTIEKVETIDGFKFSFGTEDWLLVRPSGTEPVLRIYGQTENHQKTQELLDMAIETLLAE
jgi:phosphomannomutase